jgi:hypothetical protein
MGNPRRNPHLAGSQGPHDDENACTGDCGTMVTTNSASGSLPTQFGNSSFGAPISISRLVAQPLGYWWLRDGRLAVSLHPLQLGGEHSLAATLLHDGDDQPYKQYFSTEEGNDPEVSGPLSEARRPAFVLQTEGVEGCPIHEAQRFRIMIARSTGMQHP